ncbi:HAD family hydrolase [Bacillus sp. FJAT-50079]|uniref:HAD family hydrolase n=1 Tax=Bacillus sp. FJAT-50079 TaxID=2833577 RepID=UPI001BCA32CD|nr:HAD family hydrolase [Bacillus sp. FJAT-50079]MBS4207064.1 HAD family hydrolase [Bacillus sp. FJAT-50079]
MDTVVFDLDDTLYDRSQPLKKTLLNFEATKGLSFEHFHGIFQRNSDIAFDHVTDRIWSLEESHIFRMKESAKQMGVHISNEGAREFQSLYEENQQHIELYPSIIEILDYLHEKDVPTLIMTNGPSAHQRNKIKNLGLDLYFTPDQIIVSGEEGIAKPNTEIFKLTESKFQFDKAYAWFIGDSYDNDIVGASKAGWHSIWLAKQKLENHSTNLSTYTVSSTTELKDCLFRLFK